MFIAYFKNLIIFSTLVLWVTCVTKCTLYVNKLFYKNIQFRDLLLCHFQFRAGLPITSLLYLCQWEHWVPRPGHNLFSQNPIVIKEGCAFRSSHPDSFSAHECPWTSWDDTDIRDAHGSVQVSSPSGRALLTSRTGCRCQAPTRSQALSSHSHTEDKLQ